jgi:IS5 family transposase
VRGDRTVLSEGACRGRSSPGGLGADARIHFLQQWYALSDPAVEEALYDSASMRRFVGIDLGREPVPDETTVCKFRHVLEKHGLAKELFKAVNRHLHDKGLKLSQGTIVDATILGAPPSTKNRDKAGDPEMHQSRKGQQWYFGMKAHIGVDEMTGWVHSVVTRVANVGDATQVGDLLQGKEKVVFGDAGYIGAEKHAPAKRGRKWHIAAKRSKVKAIEDEALRGLTEQIEHLKASIRAAVEHPFRVIKRQFGQVKVRYRGLAKNGAQVLTLFALSNLWMTRKHLLGKTG